MNYIRKWDAFGREIKDGTDYECVMVQPPSRDTIEFFRMLSDPRVIQDRINKRPSRQLIRDRAWAKWLIESLKE